MSTMLSRSPLNSLGELSRCTRRASPTAWGPTNGGLATAGSAPPIVSPLRVDPRPLDPLDDGSLPFADLLARPIAVLGRTGSVSQMIFSISFGTRVLKE